MALHPMGFSVPRRLLAGRWALTPPFHPYRGSLRSPGGIFSVALSVRAARAAAARVYPSRNKPGLRGIAPDGVRTFLPRLAPEAILRPSKTVPDITLVRFPHKRRVQPVNKSHKVFSPPADSRRRQAEVPASAGPASCLSAQSPGPWGLNGLNEIHMISRSLSQTARLAGGATPCQPDLPQPK